MIRAWCWKLFRRVLFWFDAETIHHWTLRAIQSSRFINGVPLRALSGASNPQPQERVRVFDIDFQSRLGLAAGFDKNAEIIEQLPLMGFGFVEIGTVTPRPQPGNPRPRLFRDAGSFSIFNRMGFNSEGAETVSRRLSRVRDRGSLPPTFRVGVNLGKNKETPNSDAPKDYLESVSAFEGLADYIVINVSSPNTPGLRDLQRAELLRPIVEAVKSHMTGWKKVPPLLLKLAPELSGEDFVDIIRVGGAWGVDGWVLTNTLGGTRQGEQGGISGAPLAELSMKSLREVRALTSAPVISVGGIMNVAAAVKRLDAGAQLIQIYSGWIFEGPGFPVRIRDALGAARTE